MLLLLACAPLPSPDHAPPPMVMQRPGDALPALGPDARIDLGLRTAAEELAAAATSPDGRLTPAVVRLALARAGYPGDASFVRVLGGSALPEEVVAQLPRGVPVDVGWAARDFANGTRLWVLGWCPRLASIDPLPRDPTAGAGIPLRVDGPATAALYLGTPEGHVLDVSLTPGTTRFIPPLSSPGEYRVEIVEKDRVALLFSLFVGMSPPAVGTLPPLTPVESPLTAAETLYQRVDTLRQGLGLPSLARFPAYEAPAREHAACLAHEGRLAHASAACPGVPTVAARTHHPRAKHHENLAVALTADEAWDVIFASPGHRRNLLCLECTHVAIGAAIEPAVAPRLFVAIETLEFPDGPPQPFIQWR